MTDEKTKEDKKIDVRQVVVTLSDNKPPELTLTGDFTYPELMSIADYLYQDALKRWLLGLNEQLNGISQFLSENAKK
jgi:hypothetical protein